MLVPELPLLFFDTAWRVGLVLLGIGGVIFFHELGHFLVARWCGVRTEAFSLAFPPNVLWGQREAGGLRVKWFGGKGDGWLIPWFKSEKDPTEYRVGLIPIGGYVKMAGEGIGEGVGDPDELRSKSVAQRGAIFSAGVVMNAIFAFVAFTIAFQLGVPLPGPVIGGVEPGWPGEQAGVKPGDRIVGINGAPIEHFSQIISHTAHAEGTVTLEVERDGKRLTLPPVKPREDEDKGLQMLGLYGSFTTEVTKLSGPAVEAGLKRGDRITQVNGRPVQWLWQLRETFDQVAFGYPESFDLTVERAGATPDAPQTLQISIPASAATFYKIGIGHLQGTRIDSIAADSPLARTRLQPDDLIVAIDETLVREKGFDASLAEFGGDAAPMIIQRGDDSVTLTLPTDPAAWAGVKREARARVTEVSAGSPAWKAGLRAGWWIRQVAGKPVETVDDISNPIRESQGKSIELTAVDPAGAAHTMSLRPVVFSSGAIGIEGTRQYKEVTRLGFFAALGKGWEQSLDFGTQVLQMFKSMAQRRVSAKNLGGPLTIGAVAWNFSEEGVGAMLYFLGILSVNLAILNVLPIPVLDGGHLFFLLIEAVRRRPVSENVQIAAQYVGLLLLLGLMVFVTVNDIGRFWG